MADAELPDLSEPTPIPCLYVTGGLVHVEECSVRIVMWTALPDQRPRMRTQIRFAMAPSVAETLVNDLGKGLTALSRRPRKRK